jgi:hypothetical protein
MRCEEWLAQVPEAIEQNPIKPVDRHSHFSFLVSGREVIAGEFDKKIAVQGRSHVNQEGGRTKCHA